MSKKQDNSIIIFKTEDEKISVDVRFDEETVWLTIDDMAKLFEKSRSTVNEHILNVYAEGELDETTSKRKIGISDFSTTPTRFFGLLNAQPTNRGTRYEKNFYSLF